MQNNHPAPHDCGDYVFLCDATGTCIYASPGEESRGRKLDTYSGEAWQALGLPRAMGQAVRVYGAAAHILGRARQFNVEGGGTPHGACYYRCEACPLALDDGQGLILRLRLVDGPTEGERGVDEFDELLRESPTLAAALIRIDDGTCLRASKGLQELLGASPEQLSGRQAEQWFESPGEFWLIAEKVGQEAALVNLEVNLRGAADERVVALVSGHCLDGDGQAAVLLLFVGVGEYRRLAEAASYDALTALPTRHHLGGRLVSALRAARTEREMVGVLFLDLNGFKAVNDTHGHDVGDRVLTSVARRLASSVRDYDTVARVGGDEFVIVLQHIAERRQAERIAENLCSVIGEPLSVEGKRFDITASVGVALYPGDGETPAALVRHADKEMYCAKFNEPDMRLTRLSPAS